MTPAIAKPAPSRFQGTLNTLGLHRPELRAWAMYDWGISSLQTVVMTAVFPAFFIVVAGSGIGELGAKQWYSGATTIASLLVAVLSPVLGAVADYRAAKKRFLATFLFLGVGATAAMFFIQHGMLVYACVTYVLAVGAASASTTFYESLLPHIASQDEMDRVSTGAYALGYLGGGIVLAVNLAMISMPQWFGLPHGEGLSRSDATLPVRLGFLLVAAWWLLFSIPLLRRVPEPPRTMEPDESGGNTFRTAFTRLGETVRELRRFKHAFLMMLAFTIYNDGIQTIIRMATVFATELNIAQKHQITAILLVQFIGIPCAFAFGALAGRIGAKRSVFLGLLVYTGICVYAQFMQSTRDFYVLAAAVGLVQGGTQALSRSLFANMIPKHKSGEFFGFYSVFEKFGGILGPLVFWVALGETGSARGAIIWVIGFFVVGAAVLTLVDVKKGELAARASDAQTRAALM